MENEPKKSKVEISSEWNADERESLITILNEEIARLNSEEQGLRKTIHYEARCFKEIDAKRDNLNQLREYARDMPTAFLEINRENYRPYITQK